MKLYLLLNVVATWRVMCNCSVQMAVVLEDEEEAFS